MIGGFGCAGSPIELFHALVGRGPRDLTIINNNAGNGSLEGEEDWDLVNAGKKPVTLKPGVCFFKHALASQ